MFYFLQESISANWHPKTNDIVHHGCSHDALTFLGLLAKLVCNSPNKPLNMENYDDIAEQVCHGLGVKRYLIQSIWLVHKLYTKFGFFFKNKENGVVFLPLNSSIIFQCILPSI